MICLKNRTFAVSQTTRDSDNDLRMALWFAWKIVLLQYRKQRLSFLSFTCKVVICLKNRTFAVSQTTRASANVTGRPLWFAWKIVLLQYRKQHAQLVIQRIFGCDLLEKSYFCSIANNVWTHLPYWVLVVICLKNRTFAVSQTTAWPYSDLLELLWFAWKIVLLQYRKQRQWIRGI